MNKKRLEYDTMFAVVVKPMSYKWHLTVEVKHGCQIHNTDLFTAFRYGFLDEVIYVN